MYRLGDDTMVAVPPVDQRESDNILDTLRREWLVVAVCIFLSLVAGSIYLRVASYEYTAQIQVTPAALSGSSSGSALGQLGGIASLAGIEMPSGQATSPFKLYLVSLQSAQAASQLIKRQDLMHVVFSREWDASARQWHEPAAPPVFLSAVKSVLGVPTYPWHAPDPARLRDYLVERIKINEDTKRSVVTISLSHKDPQFAVAFLGALNQVVDDQIRARALRRADDSVAYLSEKLKTVSVAEQRVALTATLSDQEKMRMMASSGAPYAADPIGPPTASFKPTSPLPTVVIVGAFVIGTLIGFVVAMLSDARKRRRCTAQAVAETNIRVPAN